MHKLQWDRVAAGVVWLGGLKGDGLAELVDLLSRAQCWFGFHWVVEATAQSVAGDWVCLEIVQGLGIGFDLARPADRVLCKEIGDAGRLGLRYRRSAERGLLDLVLDVPPPPANVVAALAWGEAVSGIGEPETPPALLPAVERVPASRRWPNYP